MKSTLSLAARSSQIASQLPPPDIHKMWPQAKLQSLHKISTSKTAAVQAGPDAIAACPLCKAAGFHCRPRRGCGRSAAAQSVKDQPSSFHCMAQIIVPAITASLHSHNSILTPTVNINTDTFYVHHHTCLHSAKYIVICTSLKFSNKKNNWKKRVEYTKLTRISNSVIAKTSLSQSDLFVVFASKKKRISLVMNIVEACLTICVL